MNRFVKPFFVALAFAAVQACGPTSNLNMQQPHRDTNIVINPESIDVIDVIIIKSLVAEVIDTSGWASVNVLAKPGVLYLALAPKDNWGLEFCQVFYNEHFEVTSVGYDTFWPTSVKTDGFYPSCPNSKLETYWTTGVDTIPSSIFVIRNNHAASAQRGYQSTYAIGAAESLDNVLNFLSCSSLTLWGRVGHGFSGGLLLAGGEVLSDFSGVSLAGKGIYANSCLAHNSPFEDIVLAAGADWYISGDVNLYVGYSEKVLQCWWNQAKDQAEVCNALSQCEHSTQYPRIESHGCSGSARIVPPPDNPSPPPDPTPHPTPTPDPTLDPDGDNPLTNDKFEALPWLAQGEWIYFTIDVPEGYLLSVHTGYGSGDPDLYVKAGTRPTLSSYDCKSDNPGTWESCYIYNPSGLYHVAVSAYEPFSEVLLRASF